MDRELILRWAKRLLVYLAGLFCMALGVVFSVKSALGVSPVTCLANVVYQITLTLPGGGVDLGICTTAVYCLYILVELLILRRQFKPVMLLQIVASFLFGALVSLATSVMSFLPAPESYPMRMLFLLISIPLVALGVMLYLAPNILPTPGEGMSLAISTKTGLSVANCKTIFDCTMVVVSAAVSLIYFHGLVGVREGTVLSALLVGFVMKRMMRVCQAPLLRFVERESKVERAANAAQPVVLDRSGKPKIMVTLGREFGSGGHEIAQKLAQELGVTFYDQQLIPMEARESGLSEDFVRGQERHLAHEVIYDFMTSGYAMSNQGLAPLERLFAARTAILRRLAASDESFVIVGRCADYILYDDPNSFRIFVHAAPEQRVVRIQSQFHTSPEQARRDLEATDRGRSWVYKQCTGRNWGDGRYYNLTVDSGKLGIDGSVELILNAIRVWCDVRGVSLTPLAGKSGQDGEQH